ncbi:KR domain-containing protein [Nocardia brasiliensis]|nr:KR domain-containing protein [Nocardia brasiliensis]ASF10864.1 KR domain-containing protein [Nocardia brasiliensis]SUB10506.1 Beta-ketoacyl-acyl-carrier-protein synthase I [Nocardia brasiliensis]
MTAAGVSIVGIGCRISGAASADEYWRMLHARPPGAVAGIEPFDHDWFGLSAREHAAMAAAQRLAMTVAVEALDDAGIGYRAPGSSAAVLFGAGAGTADLLSTALDLRGPSLTLDSAQASFLTALGMAVRLLDDAAVPFAIVGDVIASPPNPLSATEVRTSGSEPEHCAVVILQRTADAARDGNRQYAQITEVAFGSNGRVGAAPERASSAAAATVGELVEAALRVYHGDRPLEPDAAETPTAAAALVRVRVRAGGSTYAEVVLHRSPATGADRGYEPPVLIPVTGRDNAELRAQAQRYAMRLERAAGAVAAATVREFAAATARLIPERTRAVVLAQDRDDAMTQLHALAHGEASTAVLGPSSARRPGRLLFLFSGQSALHVAMGRALAARHRVFAAALAETAETIVAAGGPRSWTPKHGFALAAPGGSAASGAHPSALVVPALFTFQVAVTELLSAWGIRPDAVAGHGLGELAAAAVSGALPLADAARVVVQHSRLPAPGSTAAALLTATPEDAATLIEPLRGQVHLAAVNGPRAVLVTGSARYIETVIRRAKRRNMFARRLTDDADPHGRTGAVPSGFLDALADLRPAAPHTPMYSTVRHGAALTGPAADGRYWAENASGTVQLAAALAHAAVDGVTTVVEIAPQPVLSPAVRAYPDFRDAVYPVATRADEAGDFLACLARLHLGGRPIEWSAQGPFAAAPRRIWRRPRTLPDPQTAEPTLPADDLVDHLVCGTPTVPASFWLRILLRHAGAEATVLSDFVVHEQAEFAMLARVRYRVLDSEGSLRAEVTDGGALASARPGGDPTPADIVAWMRVVDTNRAGRHRMRVVAPAAFYDELQCRRLAYGPRLRVLRGIALGSEQAVGLFDAAELHSTATVEGCLQLLAATGYEDAPADAIPLPVGIESAWLSAEPRRTVLEAHAFLRTRSTTGLLGDVIGTDQHGVPCLVLSGVRIRFAAPDTPAVDAPRPVERPFSFRQETWQPGELPDLDQDPLVERALIIGDSALADRLSTALAAVVPTDRVPHGPEAARPPVAAALAHGPAALVLVWPETDSAAAEFDDTGAADSAASVGHVLVLLQQVLAAPQPRIVTIVLPAPRDPAAGRPRFGELATSFGIAGLVRSLQRESDRTVRLVWADTDTADVPALCRLLVTDAPGVPVELRLSTDTFAVRRFAHARRRALPATVDIGGTYVVTGGLGTLGSIAVRWLLDSGARDVVVLTRAPRPIPALLDGWEDRIVVVRCDAADRADLANALNDIRECGSTIRGVVHAAADGTDAAFEAVTPAQLTTMFAPKLHAARNLIELTAADPTDFVLLCSTTTGALGAPGRAADAAANAAMDALASVHVGRRVLSIGWDRSIADPGGTALPRTGAARRGAGLLTQVLRYSDTYLLTTDEVAPVPACEVP